VLLISETETAASSGSPPSNLAVISECRAAINGGEEESHEEGNDLGCACVDRHFGYGSCSERADTGVSPTPLVQ